MKKLYKELKKKGVINDKVTLGDVWNKQARRESLPKVCDTAQ
jgi:hypothetical protein